MTNENMVCELAKLVSDLTSKSNWSLLTREQRGMVRGALLFGSRMIRLYNREELEVKKLLQER